MDGHEEEVALFSSLTGADAGTGIRYLEAMDWDVQGAYEMFMEVDGSAATSTPARRASPPPVSAPPPTTTASTAFPMGFDRYGIGEEAGAGAAAGWSGVPTDEQAQQAENGTTGVDPMDESPPDATATAAGTGNGTAERTPAATDAIDQATQDAIAAALAEDEFEARGGVAAIAAGMGGVRSMGGGVGGMSGPLTATSRRFNGARQRSASGGCSADEIDPDTGVRRPTKAYKDTLIDTRPSFPAAAFGGLRGGDLDRIAGMMASMGPRDIPDSDWMFPPPKSMRQCRGDFQYAKETAKEQEKWLLVNLQSVDIFDSHCLNRDTWVDDTVQGLVDSAFVFWQRSSSCADGQNYMRLYAVSANELPHIAVVGPTGAKIWTHKGYLSPSELSARLMEFLDQHSLSSMRAPKARFTSTLGHDAAPHFDLGEGDASSAGGEGEAGVGVEARASSSSAGGGPDGGAGVSGAPSSASEDEQILAAAIAMSMTDAKTNAPNQEDKAEPRTSTSNSNSNSNSSSGQPKTSLPDAKPATNTALPSSSGGAAGCEAKLTDADRTIAPVEGHGQSVGAHNHLPHATLPPTPAPEPAPGTPATTRLQIKLADGTTAVRRFNAGDPIMVVFGVVCELLPEASTTGFTLQSSYPTHDLKPQAEDGITLEGAGLLNSRVVMRWL